MGLRHRASCVMIRTVHKSSTAEPGGNLLGADEPAARPSKVSRYLSPALLTDATVLGLTVALVIIMTILNPRMISAGNVANIMSNYWPLLLVVSGQVFVLITAGIDLSQTATMALANVTGAILVTTAANPDLFEKSPWWGTLLGPEGGLLGATAIGVLGAWLVMLVLGAAVGLLNGWAVTRLNMPPFMVTLATLQLVTAVAIWSTKSENVINLPESYVDVGTGTSAAVIAVAAAVVAHLVLSRTLLGRWLYAVGVNKVTARVSGVPVGRVVVSAYVISGMFAALGGALYSARLDAGRPTLGASLLMDVIGAAVIGGVSLLGGRGRIVTAALGVLLFVVLSNALNLLGLEFHTVMWVKGVVILGAVGVDTLRTRRLRQGGGA